MIAAFFIMKTYKLHRIFLLLVSGLIIYTITGCSPKKNRQYVVMLSMDAFRWDYPDSIPTPNLDYIAETGVKAKSLKPCFPSKTFPNHYSIATGLYPDHHGIVQNSFYDPEIDKYYAIRMREAVEDGNFYGGEPIWNTAEKQGVKTASYFWVGSEADIQGMRPSRWKKYDHHFPYEQRIDSVIAWLQLPEKERPHLILWYINEPDDIGHSAGPGSMEVREKVMYLDSLVGVFTRKVEQLPIAGKINLIFTADHGMGTIDSSRQLILSQHLDEEWVTQVQGSNPSYNIQTLPEYYDTVYTVLSNLDNIKAWKSGEIPAHLHYGTNPRTLDFVVVADSGA